MLRKLLHSAPYVLALAVFAPAATKAQVLPSASEADDLSGRSGRWTVTETVWERPGAAAATSTGLVAERRMVGDFLEEQLLGSGDASAGPKRIDYLGYDRVAGRWSYVSLETRVPVPLMPAWSIDRGDPGRIEVDFAPFAMPGSSAAVLPGSGASPVGQMLRMQELIVRDGPDHEIKDQFFVLADGTGRRWLAHRYDYVRQR